ncbi:heterokaryon incompatibility protein-domain-containing protein [Podospora australis]|uniref:Heterokaryon incompatibility protein-domain-containing protein n=1 Tax=Podospora australis TaxID=1536484 RepID=A0AAN7AG43_9PEZI|nr:heterokaryon incompatibility protein-domain-containing protein [Podospora australis]
MAATYAYTHLPSTTSLRLVDLVGLSPNGDVNISLLTVDLDLGVPPFNALSYTWGDPRCSRADSDPAIPPEAYLEASHEIRCDDRRFMVRPNLRDALRMLLTFLEGLPRCRFIWIDAICIDQSNMHERTSQVQMMARIYESAHSIVGWLGPADHTTANATRAIERLSSVFPLPRTADDVRQLRSRLSLLKEADFFNPQSYETKLGIQHVTGEEWLSFLSLLYRPYFERAWIVQEITLARNIVLVIGDRIIPWVQFAGAVFFVMSVISWITLLNREILPSWVDAELAKRFRGLLDNKDPRLSTIPLAAANVVKLRAYARGHNAENSLTPKTFSLRSLLNEYRSTSATDPRDKVFAMLSMANRSKPPFTIAGAGVTLAPNYQLSVVAVYLRLARLTVQSNGDLRLFQHRELNNLRKIKDLPSWVPDYSVWQQPQSLAEGIAGSDWKASCGEKWRLDGRALEDPLLTGYGKHGDADRSMRERFLGRFHRFNINHFDRSPGERRLTPMLQAFHNEPGASLYGTRYFLESVTKFASDLQEVQDVEEASWASSTSNVATRRRFDFSSGSNPLNGEFRRQSEFSMACRVVFRTDGHQLLGLGPADMCVGDEVWVLAGADTPVILRPTSLQRRKLLGESFVYGMMHGEALTVFPGAKEVVLE